MNTALYKEYTREVGPTWKHRGGEYQSAGAGDLHLSTDHRKEASVTQNHLQPFGANTTKPVQFHVANIMFMFVTQWEIFLRGEYARIFEGNNSCIL